MTNKWKNAFEEALEPLYASYGENDDGDPVTLALDTAASLLMSLPTLRRYETSASLDDLLAQAGEPREDVRQVKQLYRLARQGDYTSSFSEGQAEELTSLAQDVAAILEEFARKHARRKRSGAAKAGATKAVRGKKKRGPNGANAGS